MKQFYLITLFLLVKIAATYAQKPMTIHNDSALFGTKYLSGLWVTIPEVKAENLKTRWIKTIQKGTKSKVSTVKNEMTIYGAILPSIQKGNINVMSQIENLDSLSRLFVSVETSRDIFIVPESALFDNFYKYVFKFAKEQYIETAKDQLAIEESKLRDIEKDLKTARKEKEKSEKDIQASKIKISEENDKINAINKEISILSSTIESSSSYLSTMEDGDLKKTKQSELKDLQKKKKGLLKDINNAENRISRANTSIEDQRKNIELNERTQEEIKQSINLQKTVVAKFQKKLKTIEAY